MASRICVLSHLQSSVIEFCVLFVTSHQCVLCCPQRPQIWRHNDQLWVLLSRLLPATDRPQVRKTKWRKKGTE